MRSRGSKMSKIEVEPHWKPRRNRRNRKWRDEPRKMRALSAKIIKLVEDEDLDGRNSPCSVVSFSLSLDNRIEDAHENSEWIRTAHIKNPALNGHNRRSPLFTGRLLHRNEFLDDRRRELSYDEFSSEVGRNPITSRLSIRDRLEPVEVCTERLDNIPPCLESPRINIHHRFESPNVSIHQRIGAPLAIRSRESVAIAGPPEQVEFHQNQQDNESAARLYPRDDYEAYNAGRFSRNQFSPPQRPRNYRRSLYFPPGYTSPPKQDTVRRQRPLWPWLKTSVECSENPPDHPEHYIRRDRQDYNVERFSRDPYLAPSQRHFEQQSEYNRSQFFDHSRNNLREPRTQMSLSSHQVNNYSDYPSESYEMDSNNRRDDGQFDWSYPQVESYSSAYSPQRFYNSRPLPYPSASPRDAVMDNPRYRSLMDLPSNNWEGPPGQNYYSSYQDR